MTRPTLLAAALLASLLSTERLAAMPPRSIATRVFELAKEICRRDDGKLWGTSLCGPILLVDHEDRTVVANVADAGGLLIKEQDQFHGTLPADVIISNTPTDWSGTRWSQLVVASLPSDATELRVLLAHELFHRVQTSLNLSRAEAANQHLDTPKGRYLLQLEWRALATALSAGSKRQRTRAIGDAIEFRRSRYALFPAAAEEEAALETNEGIPEYTGVRLGLETDEQRRSFALKDLTRFVDSPTFVRSFAYASGPAYGLLLDSTGRPWLPEIRAGSSLHQLLESRFGPQASSSDTIEVRAARYGGPELYARESIREEQRLTRLAELRGRLVEGPVVTLPLAKSRIQFNPQTLIPMAEAGTIYPSARLVDEWGSLEVETGGMLVRKAEKLVTVTAAQAPSRSSDGASGQGWTLELNKGWTIRRGSRPGDFEVVRLSSPPSGQ